MVVVMDDKSEESELRTTRAPLLQGQVVQGKQIDYVHNRTHHPKQFLGLNQGKAK